MLREDLKNYPFMNKNLPIDERISDLINRMTLEEKVRQLDIYSGAELLGDMKVLTNFDGEKYKELYGETGIGCLQIRYSSAKLNNQIQEYHIRNTRLGIPILFSEETLHGLVWPEATIFPQQIALAGTFEPELAYKQGRAIAAETRSVGVHEGWSPVLDLARDPRWGRVEEGYGEDTYLGARFAYDMVKGLQGDDLTQNNAIVSEPKHFSGYGAPSGGLNCGPAMLGRRDHANYCLPIFEAAFRAGALNTMCSYNTIDGVAVAGDKELLTKVLRDELGMKGFVRSDMTAIRMLHTCHYTAKSDREAIKMGIEAGVDMQLYDYPHEEYQNTLMDFVKTGEVPEETINLSCSRVLRVKFMLGLFENPLTDESLSEKVVNCQEYKNIALEVAEKSICLLKNSNNLLPLKESIKNIAVIGPSAAACRFGDYSSASSVDRGITLLDGIKGMVSDDTIVTYNSGCSILDADIRPIPQNWLRDRNGKSGLTGEYYNELDFSGDPVCTRTDCMINFNFIYSKPAPGVNADRFAVRWSGTLVTDHSFKGCIGLSTMDSMKLWIDDEVIIDGWEELNANQMVDFDFIQGREYKINIEYKNDQRGARVILGYNTGRLNMEEAIRIAKAAEVAIVAVGDSEETCGENLDRADLNLPGKQLDLVKAIYATGTPIVLVLQNGRPLSITWENDNIPAIIEAWHVGEQGGKAIAEVIFGEVNPAGRLPMSFPKSVGQLPVHYNRCPFSATKYVEMDWLPLYPFGYGLSYTNFKYSNIRLSKSEIKANETVEVLFDVTNIGDLDGEEVAQLYIHDEYSSVLRPYKELAGFKRIHLKKGETKTITLTLGNEQLRVLNKSFKWVVEEGKFEVMVGNNSANILLTAEFNVTQE
ncbi:glycoside hydrolase family 3 protein [Anaerocolumna chitinilytica]|uniref:Beta-glucosidase n=1 Tax=Anaerocolumna chitinilytica TaxID=1727145 RepID=A0A7I8DKY9_9FIRM|nr:glycoside hydrolase family 3 protein [Anaerocolumna chitinilytica]BCJ98992.1 beta-glucosidase [Anaerocolumna chitinilytica]